jgi:hypothetical protein
MRPTRSGSRGNFGFRRPLIPRNINNDERSSMTGPARQRQDNWHSDYGVTRDNRGETQPADKQRARQKSQDGEAGQDTGRDEHPPSPGQPAGGE